jgi:hypothetical protein
MNAFAAGEGIHQANAMLTGQAGMSLGPWLNPLRGSLIRRFARASDDLLLLSTVASSRQIKQPLLPARSPLSSLVPTSLRRQGQNIVAASPSPSP